MLQEDDPDNIQTGLARVNALYDDYKHSLQEQLAILKNQLQEVKLVGGSVKKIPVVDEPARTPEVCHWDYLLKEAVWLQQDFVNERKWKKGQWKKLGREAMKHKYIVERESGEDLVEKQLRRVSQVLASEVEKFWKGVSQLATHRFTKGQELAKREKDRKRLDNLVEKTEKFVGGGTPSDLDDGIDDGDVSPSVASTKRRRKAEEKAELLELMEDAKEEILEIEGRSAGMPSVPTSRHQKLDEITASMTAAQPTGNSFSTTKVTVPIPSLFRGKMREYQHIGMEWMAALHERGLNGILADEMGLGKTIQTIALIAHLACNKGIWGPHLIVVPTSVMINWEIEFKKFCPGLKVMVYFGSPKERRQKRVGWTDPNAFHVCICSYALVLQDAAVFRKKKWYYLILDEAHHIKNFKSMRWQNLLTFKTNRRLLLTGTPLQNDLVELWSLLHFLMPEIFTSHSEFQEWFAEPLAKAIEHSNLDAHKQLIQRLHALIRPFLLRRLKRDVEKQMPSKYEHVVPIPLSSRQQVLYDEFLGHRETRQLLVAKNRGEKVDYLGLMNVLMQLRKICNHPDLLEPRAVKAPFVMRLGEGVVGRRACEEMEKKLGIFANPSLPGVAEHATADPDTTTRSLFEQFLDEVRRLPVPSRYDSHAYFQAKKAGAGSPKKVLSTFDGLAGVREIVGAARAVRWRVGEEEVPLVPREKILNLPVSFQFTRKVIVSPWDVRTDDHPPVSLVDPLSWSCSSAALMRFPEKSLLVRDSGKFRFLSRLLTQLRQEGHKVILFTQMSKMLDLIEAFANIAGFSYVRLDGSTKVTDRQLLVDRFNRNPKLFLFISSTRAGGVGINLTGADTVVFFDSDWNPAMDKQAMDRCHRIGQSRDVHIYRLISESTIEENIFVKQLQKRKLDEVVIDWGRKAEENTVIPEATRIKENQAMDDLLEGVFGASTDTNKNKHIYGTHVLWEREDAENQVLLPEALLAQVEDVEDTVGKPTGKPTATDEEEKGFLALPGIVRRCVRWVEEELGRAADDNRADEYDSSEWEELDQAQWESEDDAEE